MNRMMRYVWMILNLLILGVGMQTGSALAHEGRVFAPYIVFVGFRNEPTFEDEANGLDLFVLIDKDGNGQCDQFNSTTNTCLDWVPVNTGGGD